MKFRLLLSCVAGLLASMAISAQADTQLGHVTNNVVDGGDCYITGVNGGYGWISHKVTCGADVIYVTHHMANTCQTTVTPGYYISGGCISPTQNSYTIFKPSPIVLTKITDVASGGILSNAACSIETVASYNNPYVSMTAYRITCGSAVFGVSLTSSNGTCSLSSSAPAGYTYEGNCSFYTIYKKD